MFGTCFFSIDLCWVFERKGEGLIIFVFVCAHAVRVAFAMVVFYVVMGGLFVQCIVSACDRIIRAQSRDLKIEEILRGTHARLCV